MFPDSVQGRRVRVTRLARMLGMTINEQAELGARARWHPKVGSDDLRLWNDPNESSLGVIQLEPKLSDTTRRFAIAHEIGHAILWRDHSEIAGQLPGYWRERFANVFAAELLVTNGCRDHVMREFRDATTPPDLLRICDSVGVSPATLLRFARERIEWLRGLDQAWLDVRRSRNRHTGREPRLRVTRVYLDRERWFLPENQSVARLLGNDTWLTVAGPDFRVESFVVAISRRNIGEEPRFMETTLEATISALRLKRSRSLEGMEILLGITPHAT
jgi:hypothetical protein